jgi:hypothetical protein
MIIMNFPTQEDPHKKFWFDFARHTWLDLAHHKWFGFTHHKRHPLPGCTTFQIATGDFFILKNVLS